MAQYFPYALLVLFIVFVFRHKALFYERSTLFVQGIGASLIARALVEVIRFFIHRLRPFASDPTIHELITKSSYSFPSGHASFYFALAMVVYLHNKKWGVWFFIGALLNGVARVGVGVHYPTDIFGGAVLGVLVGWGVHRFFRKSSSL